MIIGLLIYGPIMNVSLTSLQPELVSQVVLIASQESTLACTILVYYTLHVARHKDTQALLRVLPILAQCDQDIVYQVSLFIMSYKFSQSG